MNYQHDKSRSGQLRKLSQFCHSVEFEPLFCIEPKDVVPGSLHCVMGVFFDLFKVLKKFASNCDKTNNNGCYYVKELDKRLNKIGAFESTWFQSFSGKKSNCLIMARKFRQSCSFDIESL